MNDLPENIASSVKAAFDSFLQSDEFADVVDVAVYNELENAKVSNVQIWLGNNKESDVASVSIGGCEDVNVVPFFIPAPFIPVKADFKNQVLACNMEIANLRRFSDQVKKMADDAQLKLDYILQGR